MEYNALNVFIAETIGTMLLILLGDGVVAGVLLAKSKANNAGWIVITAAWAFAVFVGVVVAGPISGAHLNPAVTVGLAVNGSTPWDQVPVYLAGEMVGAMIGATLVLIHYWDHFKITEDQGLKLAVFSTGPNIRNYALNFVSEVIGTFVLVFVVIAFGANAGGLAGLGPWPSRSSCSRSACRSAARPGTRSTRPATWVRASSTSSCPSRARAPRTGVTPGSRSSARSSAASWLRWSTRASGSA